MCSRSLSTTTGETTSADPFLTTVLYRTASLTLYACKSPVSTVLWSSIWISVLMSLSCLLRSEPSPLSALTRSISTSVMWVILPASSRSHQERGNEERTCCLWNGESVWLQENKFRDTFCLLVGTSMTCERENCTESFVVMSGYLKKKKMCWMSLNSSGRGSVVSWVGFGVEALFGALAFIVKKYPIADRCFIFIITSSFSCSLKKKKKSSKLCFGLKNWNAAIHLKK